MFTVIGHSGFIGQNLVSFIKSQGYEVFTPERDLSDLGDRELGHVIYAAGVTGGMQSGLYNAVDAHINVLYRAMERSDFTSWVYLSSSRVYGFSDVCNTAQEDALLQVKPNIQDFFSLTKLVGETLCLSYTDRPVCVARLSNVYGSGQNPSTFLSIIGRELKRNNGIEIRESQDSCKDYISIFDAVHYLVELAKNCQQGIFNVGSGYTVTHQEIANILNAHGYQISFAQDGIKRAFPALNVDRITSLYGLPQRKLLNDVADLVKEG